MPDIARDNETCITCRDETDYSRIDPSLYTPSA
jgi:hypothetical protein